MVTFSVKFILFSGTLVITRAVPITGLPKSLVFLGNESIGPVPMLAVVLVFMAVVFWIFRSYTAPGRIINVI
jgi:ribose/xylose/arabinose/galactoside ABC-type transport system permease subunit